MLVSYPNGDRIPIESGLIFAFSFELCSLSQNIDLFREPKTSKLHWPRVAGPIQHVVAVVDDVLCLLFVVVVVVGSISLLVFGLSVANNYHLSSEPMKTSKSTELPFEPINRTNSKLAILATRIDESAVS